MLHSHNMSLTQARLLLVSEDDYSSAVSTIAWVFLVATFFGVAARLSTRYEIKKIQDRRLIDGTSFGTLIG